MMGYTKKQRQAYGISKTDFVRLWQSSEDIDAFTASTKMSKNAAFSRVSYYRNKCGVALKQMPATNRVNSEALNKVIEEAA